MKAVLCLVVSSSIAQTDSSLINAGIWQYTGYGFSKSGHPEMLGRLSYFRWADLEPSPNVWNWTSFDSELTTKTADSLPVIFMVYTKQDAPDWLYSNGVPKVTEKNNGIVTGWAPYYADPEYKMYFKRMITAVSNHVKSLPASIRNRILAVQGCYGSTGDYISYKGTVDAQYNLTSDDFLALFEEFSQYYYDEYKKTNPSIRLLSNPPNGGTGGTSGQTQVLWLMQNCPGSWLKNGTLGKGYQLNDEKTKAGWLFPIMNSLQQNTFIRTRSEITGSGLISGWWAEGEYKNMFALMCYAVHWGLDWSNQNGDQLNDPLYDSAFRFFDKYAGQKDPLKSTNAMCALKDAIDASDTVRFPENIYGTATRTATRLQSVVAPFIPYGAKLEDPYTATLGEYDNLSATGINDAGWDLFPGNYERYLHQINANTTSAGYWNVSSADLNSMYGRFARGFDVANGKNALYFNVEDSFLNNAALNGAYPVMIDITYLDRGTGKFQLFYDAQDSTNKSSITVTCTNTNLWKKTSVTFYDAYFGNRGTNGADFYIKNIGSENVLFSVVELARPHANNADVGFAANALVFDSLCVNSVSDPQPLTVSGLFLNGQKVTIGPLKGFSFSVAQDSTFADSLNIMQYGASFKQTVYVKFNPVQAGSYNGYIPVKGGGVATYNAPVSAKALAPATLSASVTNISCYNLKNGAINLTASGATAPITYSWTNPDGFKSTAQDISNLKPSTYTVTVKSAGGCSVTASYNITQPDAISVNLSADTMVCKGGTTTMYVNATGGTQPYYGTGSFIVSAGYRSVTVTDKNGCTGRSSITIINGTLTAPVKPTSITGTTADAKGLCGGGDFSYTVSATANATSYSWVPPLGSTVSNATTDGSNIILHAPSNFNTGTLSVYAVNVCGSSLYAQTKSLTKLPAKPGAITGPTSAKANQTGLVFSVPATAGIKYIWTVPGKAVITSGQNTSSITVTWGSVAGNVTVSANNNCGASARKSSLYVNLTAGAVQNASAQSTTAPMQLLVLPNPVTDVATLLFSAKEHFNYSVSLVTLDGKKLWEKKGIAQAGENKVLLHVSEFANGIYMILFKNENGEIKTIKLIKQ